ncbi:1-deoxy-D-xylulose-5-phosphate reductoisomerase [Laribacter hongkongensis]|uniref:1-deoxy-D-xylulose 5-phosphate reductoisomerase n=1 Tax=Laribacter hongkongensis TaxID=168471 RepID=A0ABD4SRB9_9NEIS|nr:1-deoxy-D-xylulose-5-phosphate reductoisomerase [Laribacter hongkongensis]MCG9026255.1 1-deoxy-D-xylulose-5-phosphate reductoisomerase [Laribacter hongkongensis]MCG9063852.1 1-deoxy-D-xylulose-5-phosphate reductoisomerase [Laribacter hongkongensis]MCG9099398.1 1-deoxy-D-xylulose-5-phosphate reductoisomerase [Laribacter hongkongensis]MCG9102484.1 1-deoxy-D-xylulose-5-phosphate reductoisomerase [Laribacter hongkongensis]MCG9111953.1 1-deoxy-D-xylulose-5-phosphate reductoisomerase [Laribacter 
MQRITVLGATGTIGVNTLDVIARHPERFSVFALTGHRQVDRLAGQCRQFRPQVAVVADAAAAGELARQLSGMNVEILHGEAALVAVAASGSVDAVMSAIVGAAGLAPTMAAVRAGKQVYLANKESLVVAGRLMMEAVAASGSRLLPIDSEHNAIFQSLPADFSGDLDASGVERIVLTASGGPFRGWSAQQLAHVTPEQAVAHPNWVMGRKISVDSASLMNKGLEVIEARWLFNAPPGRIEVIVHPQSVIHSMVRYRDGSVVAQLGVPDMRTPIAHALAWPERMDAGVPALDFSLLGGLTFEKPDQEHFPCLGLAFDALREGGDQPAVLNAANEVAVAAFLEKRLAFMDIPRLVQEAMHQFAGRVSNSIEELLELDAEVRRHLLCSLAN